jgi:uncharacterized SAM-binding protein YcdF (DUF218 family)
VGTAIVVPGNGATAQDGVYRISSSCLRLVREAERLAEVLPAEAVVFTGWAPAGGSPEAEQMRAAWQGPNVELVVEPTAAVTAQNASRTLPLLLERGLRRAVVVCTPVHSYRTRFFFSRLYGAAGIETDFRVAPVALSPFALVWELLALPVCRLQLRVARAELMKALRT